MSAGRGTALRTEMLWMNKACEQALGSTEYTPREIERATAATEVDGGPARYICRKCGTTWHGTKLVPQWRGQSHKCDGRMEKV